MFYTLQQLAIITGGHLVGSGHETIEYLQTDSRSALVGPKALFVALRGKQHDGHHFVGEMARRGVRCFLVEHLPSDGPGNLHYVLTHNSLFALQRLAAYHRSQHPMPVVGITGSNGKTVVKEWLAQLLATDFRLVSSPKSYNSQLGVPLSVLQTEAWHQVGVFEAGLSQPGEMSHLEPIVRPQIGVFTNLGEAHQENFESKTQKASEKSLLFAQAEWLVYRSDYPEIANALHQLPNTATRKWLIWSTAPGGNVQLHPSGHQTRIDIQHGGEHYQFHIPFADAASAENAVHCFFVLMALETILGQSIWRPEAFATLHPVEMRLELLDGIGQCTLINDCYTSDLNSLPIALDYLRQQSLGRASCVVLSDIAQSGQAPAQLYPKVAHMLAQYGVEHFYGIGPQLQAHAALFGPQARFYAHTDDFLAQLPEFRNQSILVKGARAFRFEEIARRLQAKHHRTRLEIRIDDLQHNLNYFRSLLAPNTRVMVMVKAFGYGSGGHEIASWLQHQRIHYLGVAYADEGVQLRQAGISLPILVMNPDTQAFRTLVAYRLEPEVYSFTQLTALLTFLQSQGLSQFPIHLKLDTGMHRLGFEASDLPELLAQLAANSTVRVQSVFSHLVGSEDPDLEEFTHHQINLFEKLSTQVQHALGYHFERHLLNSAGIERFPQAQYDMVRLGIGLYGVSQRGPHTRPISSLKTYLSQIRRISPGESVGYNRRWVAQRPTVVGTLPIGYADGLDRRLGNQRGQVQVRGQLVPYIGNICMDMCMIDLTDVPQAAEGDEVEIFGHSPSLHQLAQWLGTIPYEILTSIPPRVHRVYYQG